MKFPERVKQHVNQSKSFAILLYKLKDIGIFRNLTENDYGIDFEIERVIGNRVTGNYIKAQVKSQEKFKIRKDKIPTISGIDQKTLWYWSELSYRTHVILFAVDIKSENIFYTKPIFWQAIKLLDNTNKSKTIEFIKPIELDDKTEANGNNTRESTKNEITKISIFLLFDIPSLEETLYAHISILRNFETIMETYLIAYQHDPWSDLHDRNTFKSILSYCKILLYNLYAFKSDKTEDEKNIFNYQYWVEKNDDDLSNRNACLAFDLLFPPLLKKLDHLRSEIIKSRYYWYHKNSEYLKLSYELSIPNLEDISSGEEYENFKKKRSFYYQDFEVEILEQFR